MPKEKIKTFSSKKLKINSQLIEPNALTVLKILQQANFKAFLVGGAVRDLLLGKTPKDFDIVTNAYPEQVRKIFKSNSLIIGRRFKIVHVYFKVLNETRSKKYNKNIYCRQIIEVATFRSNHTNDKDLSAQGRLIVDNNYGSLLEDAYRRDFTINAFYYDPIAQVIIDQHDGIKDIENKQLKIIGNVSLRYKEDPLRIIRAIRLSAKLNLTIERNTLIGFEGAKHLLIYEPKARLFEESLKILMSNNVTQIINDIYQLALPNSCFPLFNMLKVVINNSQSFENYIFAKVQHRINNNEDVSVIFLLAALLWNQIYPAWVTHIDYSSNQEIALKDICQNLLLKLVKKIGISVNIYRHIVALYMFQFHFISLDKKQLHDVENNRKFRQAWHLYSMRKQFYSPNSKKLVWWSQYIEAGLKQREKLLKASSAKLIFKDI